MQKSALDWEEHRKWIYPVGLGLTAAGLGYLGYRRLPEERRKQIKKYLKKHIEPLATITSGGGPGVGMRIKGTPLIMDIDPTGPGAGVGIPMSAVSKFHKKFKNIPGRLYLGAELAGILPIPHVGLAVAPSDKNKLRKLIQEFRK